MITEIKFPIMDMTEFLFESERVFFSDLKWETKYTLKEKYVNKIPEWKYIDSDGKLFKVKIRKKEQKKNILSFLIHQTYELELELYHTGKIYELEELKNEILEKKSKMFHIYHNKILTLNEYETKIKNAKNFLNIIDIASFEDYKEK